MSVDKIPATVSPNDPDRRQPTRASVVVSLIMTALAGLMTWLFTQDARYTVQVAGFALAVLQAVVSADRN